MCEVKYCIMLEIAKSQSADRVPVALELISLTHLFVYRFSLPSSPHPAYLDRRDVTGYHVSLAALVKMTVSGSDSSTSTVTVRHR